MMKAKIKLAKPIGPSISQCREMAEEKFAQERAAREQQAQLQTQVKAEQQQPAAVPPATSAPQHSALLRISPRHSSLKKVQQLYGMPEQLDPFTGTLLAGVDPVAVHQTITLSVPILAFMAQNMRVRYGDGQRRWICGQSWQVGASGCGKSIMLRALEQLFLAREIEENSKAAEEAAAYSLLSEKDRRDTPQPTVTVRIIDGVPTAIAALMQLQINKGNGIYITCSECGEMSKKIRNNYYSLLLDMFKKSYDGTGESYMHKTSGTTYFVNSMKICANIGGTVDPMMKIFKWVNKDGTLSRGNLTILPERKDEEKDGVYRAPSWTDGQKEMLTGCAQRLRDFDNTEQPEDAVCDERIVSLGQRVKRHITSMGEVADDCCSRADERAMGLAYLLCAANGCIKCSEDGEVTVVRSEEADRTVEACIEVAWWWIKQCINAALAMQERLDYGEKSQKEAFAQAYKTVSLKSLADKIRDAREEAFRNFEMKYAGQQKRVEDFREMPALAELSERSLRRAVSERNYESTKRGFYLIAGKEAA